MKQRAICGIFVLLLLIAGSAAGPSGSLHQKTQQTYNFNAFTEQAGS
jgi:hypothetical protein